MSRVSKDLYNQALFEVKEHYEETGEILSYLKLERRMKTKINLEGNINYRLLPAQVSQQTLRLLCGNIKAYFSAKKDYAKHPQKYRTPPKFPSFLPKDGHFVLVFTNQKASIKSDGTLQLTNLGLLINADVNGALNILRKVIGDNFLKPFIEKVAWLIPSRGYLCYPIKVCF